MTPPPSGRPPAAPSVEHARLAESPDDSDPWRLWGPHGETETMRVRLVRLGTGIDQREPGLTVFVHPRLLPPWRNRLGDEQKSRYGAAVSSLGW